ncbi:coenzyme F420-0:L-glutamate ligase [Angustibacter sp. McL0619]|uniref:coenzyme F420-0:L-glutamate ligase n=1 Tax=Angustibacter sp. McL0619 TaxID=3415676 RepID=UPI003CFA6D1D
MPEPDALCVRAVALAEVRAGDDLAALLLAGCGELLDGDVLVVSSKVVSKALGLTADVGERDAVVAAQSVRVVAERRTPRGLAQVVESVAGPVMAAAGVDASNTAAGTVLLLPADADAEARTLRARLRSAGAPTVAVVVSDTAGRPWRTGQTDFALGAAGLRVVDDLRGSLDAGGQPLEVTERAVVDELAAAADLVKGKAAGTPAAVVRGFGSFVTDEDGPGASILLRDRGSDWFRYGHAEAARAALGVEPGVVAPPSVLPEPLQHRVERAIEVARAGAPQDVSLAVAASDGTVRVTVRGGGFDCGRFVQRLQVALWAEDLVGRLDSLEDTGAQVVAAVVAANRG